MGKSSRGGERIHSLSGRQRPGHSEGVHTCNASSFSASCSLANDRSSDTVGSDNAVNLPSGTGTTHHLKSTHTHLNIHCLSSTRFAHTTDCHDCYLRLTERMIETPPSQCPLCIHISCQPYMAPYIFFRNLVQRRPKSP